MNSTECQRCGTCCRKGGPALHGSDLDLIRNASIPVSSIYTLRPGEMLLDNISDSIIIAESDIIKIKSQDGENTCFFFDESGNACRIYADRPLECRQMKCWDTEAIRGIYNYDRLDRGKILSGNPSMLELIALHEAQCDMTVMSRLVSLRRNGDLAAAADITERINYDADLRKRAVSAHLGVAGILDFLFGRPLYRILPLQFGVPVQRMV